MVFSLVDIDHFAVDRPFSFDADRRDRAFRHRTLFDPIVVFCHLRRSRIHFDVIARLDAAMKQSRAKEVEQSTEVSNEQLPCVPGNRTLLLRRRIVIDRCRLVIHCLHASVARHPRCVSRSNRSRRNVLE